MVAVIFSAVVLSQLAIARPPVGVVGPGGEVIVFYKDGRDVVVRNCGGNYTVVNRLPDCVTVGKENRVPADQFKLSLRGMFYVADADKLKPLTKEEIAKFKTSVPGYDKIVEARKQALDAKLARIKKFIEMYGGDEKSQADVKDTEKLLASARQELVTAKAGASAIDKVNKLIDDVVDKISSSKFTFVSSSKSSDTAMYTLLKNQYDGSREECGTDEILNGTLPGKGTPEGGKAGTAAKLYNIIITPAMAATITDAQRIKDCSLRKDSSKTTSKGVKWNLVARKRDVSTGKYYEVWKDSKSGKVWGDKLDSDYTHHDAIELNMSGKVIKEKACITEEAKRASARIGDKSFGLPTIKEYEDAESNGIREVLPNMRYSWFWSASLSPYGSDGARGFDGDDGNSFDFGIRAGHSSVRCVGR